MSLTDALTTRTAAEVLADTSADIAARGGDDKSFPETSTARQLLNINSEARAREEELRAELTKVGSVALIEQIAEADGRDDWIDFKARGEFTLSRDPATYALHVLRLTNAATGIARTFAPGQVRARFGSVDFLNVTKSDITDFAGSGTLAAGASTLDLLFEAQTAGSVGNVPPGWITQLVTVFAGVSVSNPALPSTGTSIYRAARDAERNASLLDRMISRWGASSAGGSTGSIVEWLHESFVYAGVTNTVTKWYIDDTNPDGPGTTRLYIANDSGPATAEEIAVVQPYLNLRRTSGSGVNASVPNHGVLVLAAVARAVAFTAVVKNSSNLTADTDSQAVIATLNAESPLGSFTLYAAEITQLLMEVSGTVNVTHDMPDVVVAAGEVLTLTMTLQVVP